MLADKGEDRPAVSRHVPIYAFMHLLVLGASAPLALSNHIDVIYVLIHLVLLSAF